MRILAIYPGLNPVFDEVSHALPPLVRSGCQVLVLTTKLSDLKSTEQAAAFEHFQGVDIHRLYANPAELHANPVALLSASEQLAVDFKPDLIFLNSTHSLPLGRRLAVRLRVPSILRMESYDPLSYIRRRFYAGIPLIGKALGPVGWRYLASRNSALMVNDPADLARLSRISLRHTPTYYAAHCAQQPEGLTLAAQRDRDEMIYVGSLTRHKNCAVWLKTVPLLFEKTPLKRFTVVGRGAEMPVVDALRKRFGKRIHHIPGVTRVEALQRISAAWFAYTESSTGWGFLCDAWSTHTPVLCPRSTFCIVPGWSGLMPRDDPSLVASVRRLYEDPSYYEGLQDGGAMRYRSEHTAEVVGRQYLQIFREVVSLGRA